MPLIVEIGIILLLAPAVTFLFRNVRDNLGIRWEARISVLSVFLAYLFYVLMEYVPAEPFIWLRTFVGTDVILWMLLLELHALIIVLPVWWAHRAAKANTGNRGNENSRDLFAAVFADAALYAKFKDSVARGFCLENIAYYEDSTALLRSCGAPTDLFLETTVSLPTRPSADVKRDLEKMRFKFFSSEAPLQLNLSSETRANLLEALAALQASAGSDESHSILSGRVLPAVCAVRSHIVTLLFQNSWPRFQKELKDHPEIKLKAVV